ncbi:cytochrome P450 [Planosporangium thailandense]|uniref:cytochrome P450 family protein n=1 Tax=Planosporangium thailandense TaxID=765197 RepID=UPI0030B83AEB
MADNLLDTVAPTGRADLIADLAGPLPVAVICELIGVPEANRPDFRSWTDAMIAPPPDDPRAAAKAVGAIHTFLADLVAARRAEPGHDLLSAMIAARDEDDRLSEDELTSLAFLILFAGYENSVHTIGNGLLTLLRHPDALANLRAEPQHVTSAVEEILRFEPPSPVAIRRFPTEDITIGGVTVPKGETVLLAVAAANRDPDRFTEPEDFDPQRADNPHLTLGHGIHYCLGAPLARMEIEIAIGTVVRRFPAIKLAVSADELQWRPSFRSRALQALPVLLDARS